MMTVNLKEEKVPTINLMGTGKILPLTEGDMPSVSSAEITDAEFEGKVTLIGENANHLMIYNCHIGDVELGIEGSYQKIAFVNCKFESNAVVKFHENDKTGSREVLLMGCDYEHSDDEFLLIEDDEKNLDWKTNNLWIYDRMVVDSEMDVVEQYLRGDIEADFDDEFDMYGIDEPEEAEDEEEEGSSLGWKVSLASLGVAAIVGLAGKKAKKKEVENVRKKARQIAAVR